MSLPLEDRLKRFIPWYYPYKVAKVTRRNEPELGILHELVPPGCTAIDVGANRGYYSYALARIAGRVEAFEPNPVLARFARQKLGPKVRIHQVALADREGREKFYVPQDEHGVDQHLGGNLGNIYGSSRYAEHEVRVATLDSFGFDEVGFIKIDAEGSEIAVINGAKDTIARCRPNLVVELLVGWHESRAAIETITAIIPYAPLILVEGRKRNALDVLREAPPTVKSANVLFVPNASRLALTD
jgi:FkbM family methyltransferase